MSVSVKIRPICRVVIALSILSFQRVDAAIADPVLQTPTVQTVDDLNYDLGAVRAGAAVPYVVANDVPDGLKDLKYSDERKDAFFKTVLPLILSVNDDILITRKYLLKLNRAVAEGKHLTTQQRDWLNRLAVYYDRDPAKYHGIDLGELIPRVDVIPVSLAMAQGAEESGFGTSRFADQANALFGELTRDAEQGITTQAIELRGTGYLVRIFANLRNGVSAYARNLNTNEAYLPFRAARADMRLRHVPLDSLMLAKTLTPYCGCGPAYTERLMSLITLNNLKDFDNSVLGSYGNQVARLNEP